MIHDPFSFLSFCVIASRASRPIDKDQRNCPPLYAGRRAPDPEWQQALLDR